MTSSIELRLSAAVSSWRIGVLRVGVGKGGSGMALGFHRRQAGPRNSCAWRCDSARAMAACAAEKSGDVALVASTPAAAKQWPGARRSFFARRRWRTR